MTTTSQPDQARPRLIVNPVIQAYGRRWWVPREDLQKMDIWLREQGYLAVRYRNEAGHTVELTKGGLVSSSGAATYDMLETLAIENLRSGIDLHPRHRRAKMSRS